MNNKKYNQKSFTLVETMVVVAIVSMLASAVGPNSLKARVSANDTFAKKTLKTIETALEEYAMETGNYPDSSDRLIEITPPYLNEDYFADPYRGFNYTYEVLPSGFRIVATPVRIGRSGSTTFTLTPNGLSPE